MAQANKNDPCRYVGTLIGESTSREFRLAVAHEAIREQDIIAVDAELRPTDGSPLPEQIRVWAKVERIERLNPLFPSEAGHELASTRTDPLDTILSLSREMVTAVCHILGAEPLSGSKTGKLDQLRYPPKPASSAYGPATEDIARIMIGDLETKPHRALDIATLANRSDVSVKVDGHAIVTRHLAILAMTGAGKSWAARRIIEQLASKKYPIVIFDPHGDYTGLADIPGVQKRVRRYHAQFPVFEEDPETVISVVQALSRELAPTHRDMFDALFQGAQTFLAEGVEPSGARAQWLATFLGNPRIAQYGLSPNLYALADFVNALVKAGRAEDGEALDQLVEWSGRKELRINKQTAGWLSTLVGNLRRAAKRLYEMEIVNRKVAGSSDPLPNERAELVRDGGISIVALAGYTGDLQATICNLVANAIFSARVSGTLKLPVLLVLEEAHNFVPAQASTSAEQSSVTLIKQIAQEGRKFGVGLLLISQRPSRLDETTLSMCNSFVIMRMVNPADQNFVRRVMETLGEEDVQMLPDLDKGEAILSGQMVHFPVLVKMKPPKSQGEREEEDAFAFLAKARASLSEEKTR